MQRHRDLESTRVTVGPPVPRPPVPVPTSVVEPAPNPDTPYGVTSIMEEVEKPPLSETRFAPEFPWVKDTELFGTEVLIPASGLEPIPDDASWFTKFLSGLTGIGQDEPNPYLDPAGKAARAIGQTAVELVQDPERAGELAPLAVPIAGAVLATKNPALATGVATGTGTFVGRALTPDVSLPGLPSGGGSSSSAPVIPEIPAPVVNVESGGSGVGAHVTDCAEVLNWLRSGTISVEYAKTNFPECLDLPGAP